MISFGESLSGGRLLIWSSASCSPAVMFVPPWAVNLSIAVRARSRRLSSTLRIPKLDVALSLNDTIPNRSVPAR